MTSTTTLKHPMDDMRFRSSSMGSLLLGKGRSRTSKEGSSSKHWRRTSSLNGIPRPPTSTLHPQPEPPKLHAIPRHSPFGALLSRTLPDYTGKYEVGVADLEIPVSRKTFGTFKYKQMADQDVAGIAMDTALCSIFYPCEPNRKPKGVAWFPRMAQTIDGFLKMAKRTPNVWYRMAAYPVAAAAIHGTTFPATKEAPLKPPPPEQGKWPLMVFSHGVGCSRLMYSAFCGEMASRGFVVASIEHRDGTSPSSTIASEDGTTTVIDWLEWSDLYWPELEEQPEDDTILRHAQIQLRVAEIEEIVDAIQRLSRGENITQYSLDAAKIDWTRWTTVDADKPIIAGHSLGGSAALASSSLGNIDYRAVIVFDPAVQRLEPWESRLPHPLLVINSEEFTVGREYSTFANQIAHTAPELQVYSIGGSTHPSFSDVFLILPGAINKMTGLKCSSVSVIQKAVRATEQFLSGPGGHGGQVSYDEEFKDEEDRKRKMKQRGATAKNKKRNEEEGEEKGGKLYRPVGRPGQLAWHRLQVPGA